MNKRFIYCLLACWLSFTLACWLSYALPTAYHALPSYFPDDQTPVMLAR
jgi:hypothetical protein